MNNSAPSNTQPGARWMEYFALMAETAVELLHSDVSGEVLEKIFRKVMAYLDCQAFFYYLVDDKTGKLHLSSCAGIPEAAVRQLEWLDDCTTVSGSVGLRGCGVVIEHVPWLSDPCTDAARALGIKAYACHPMKGKGGKVVGTLSFGTKTRETFTGEELLLMRAVIDHVAAAISRLRDEEALREMKERFLTILDNSRDVVYRRDLRSDRSDYLSPSIEAITGYSVEEFSHFDVATVVRLMHPDDAPLALEKIKKAMTTADRSGIMEYRLKGKDGAYRWLSNSFSVLTDETGAPRFYVGAVRDISERRRLEEQLQKREEEYRTLADNSPDMLVRFDRELRYLYMNRAAAAMLGRTGGDYQGKTLCEIISDENRKNAEYFTDNLRAVVTTGAVKEIEMTVGEGAEPLFLHSVLVPESSADGSVCSVLTITRDVTQLKKAFAGLERSEAKILHIIDNINDGFFAVDRDWRFTYVNKRAASYGDRARQEYIGKSLWDIPPSPKGTGLEQIYRRVMEERVPATVEFESDVQPGLWLQARIYPTDEGISAFWSDITDKKKFEELLRRDRETLEQLVSSRTSELMKAHAELERSRRMADIGRLSATVAHEIRNPLAAIRIAAYNIQRKAQNPLLERHVEVINKKVMESDDIIQNLLSFSRIRMVNFEELDICEALRDCILTVSSKYAGWEVQLKELAACSPGDIIEADPVQFRMLIGNILDNAYQALQAKTGTITIAVGRRADDGAWMISITDTGGGIAAQEQTKMFEPFYTTRSKGTGLGLAVCREIVELHGGKIEVRSEPGAGATFTVTLPGRRGRSRRATKFETWLQETCRPPAEDPQDNTTSPT